MVLPVRRKTLSVLMCFFISSFSLLAQLASNTSLVGDVTDPSGAVVADAQVKAQNQGTGETVSATTNASGHYEFQFLKAGVYAVTVQKDGFSTTSTKNIGLSANQTVRTDFTLNVGAVDTTVEVTADTPPIKTDDAAVNEIISAKSTSELPLNGRNVARGLAITTPGVIIGMKSPSGSPGGGEGLIGAGTREIMNSISLDGVSIMNNLITTTTYKPSVDAISEVQVQTGTYPAQYGGYLGVQVNMVTKTGGNEFHGALFEFLRNEKLDAKNFFTPPGGDKAPFKQNQYGVQFNGPVIIPKLYDGRNKTFFMFGWESLRSNTAVPTIGSVLTPKMRQGDFSELLDLPTPIRIKNPNDPNGGFFENNIIPTSQLSPQALNALQYMPLPTGSGIQNNFNRNAANNTTTDQYLGRLDQSIGEKNRLFFRYTLADTQLLTESANPYNGYVQPVGDKNFVIGYTRIFTPTLINDFRFGRQTTTIDSLNFFTPGSRFPSNAGTEIGIPGFETSDSNPGLPLLDIQNYMSIGGDFMASTNWFQDDKTYQISDTLSYTRGAHNIAGGIDSRKVVTNRSANNGPRGNITFRDSIATNFAPADFLLGIPQSVNTAAPLFPGGGEQWRYGFFIQDKWQVSSRLTLNIGLRYELPIVPQSTTGNGTILNPEQTAFIPSTVPSKIPFNNADRNNWAPRFGFAYRLPSKFVLRGGFGVYYNPNQMNSYTLATTNPPFSNIFTFNNTAANLQYTLASPTGTGTVNPRPNAFTINPYLPNATMNQWSFGLERGLWQGAGISVDYLGNHSYHLDRSFFNNTPAPGPGDINARRPNPRFGVIRTIQNDLWSNYNQMSIVFRQNSFKGLTMQASYTFSKTLDVSTDSNGGSNVMDPYNPRLDYGLANWDVRHRFVTSYNYELPFFNNTDHRALRLALGGWQINGITTVQSGLPFSVTVSDRANVGQGTQRANVVGNPNVDCGSGKLDGCVSADAFALPASFTYGNSPRNFLRGPGTVNFDFSLFKNFLITERTRLQFRWETFNTLNHPNFANPNSTFTTGSTSFGDITALQNGANMRQMQFGLKLLF